MVGADPSRLCLDTADASTRSPSFVTGKLIDRRRMKKPLMDNVNHAGRRVSFVESGRGPCVALLPPGASPAVIWTDVANVLGTSFRTVAINFSGYGDTQAFSGERALQLDDEAEAVFAVLDKSAEPIHIVGHSYGGAVAVRCALMCPQRIKTLTLIEPALYPLLEECGETRLAEEVTRINAEFIERAKLGERELAFKDYYNYYNQSQDAWDGLPERLRGALVSATPTVATGLEAIHDCPTTLDDCRAISLPTLLLRGAQTDDVHAAVTDLLAKEIPRARRIVVDGAQHMLSLSHPEAVATAISDHCR